MVVQSLAARRADPLEAADLEQGDEAFAPVDAAALGAELLESDEPEPEVGSRGPSGHRRWS